MTGKEALAKATEILRAAGLPDPLRDARRLLSYALGNGNAGLASQQDDHMSNTQIEILENAIKARAQFQPVAQIIGRREFWGRSFKVTQDTLDPRPDTELMIEHALKIRPKPQTILDLGTGTGCIAISLLAELPNARGIATDISGPALQVARDNANTHQVANRLKFRQSDWFKEIDGKFDLILSNPPYIAQSEAQDLSPDVRNWEPATALFAGPDGLDAYRLIAQSLPNHLTNQGAALFEIGATQAKDVSEIFTTSRLRADEVIKDLNNKDRLVVVKAR